VHGRCRYPTSETKAYRISCHVPGPFPTTFRTRKPPIYRRPDGTWPFSEGNPDGTPLARNLPPGWALGAFCRDATSGKDWVRLVGRTELRDLDEGIVWIVAHEAFHYLRRTRQVPGRNTEIEADAFADRKLEEFRAEREEALAKSGEFPGGARRVSVARGRCRMPKPKKGTKPKGKQKQKAKPKHTDVTPPEPTAAETTPATDGAEAQPVETPAAPESQPKAKPKKARKSRAAAAKGPSAELDALRSKAAEAKEALTIATNEASALRMQAMGVEAAAKRAYSEALAPYRAACRKSGQPCEFPGIKAPSTFPRARFLIERVKGGLKVVIKDRPKTEETIPDKQLAESIWRVAREYCTRHFGEQTTDGRARGLGLRLRSALERA
jgi:hypothetical protein